MNPTQQPAKKTASLPFAPGEIRAAIAEPAPRDDLRELMAELERVTADLEAEKASARRFAEEAERVRLENDDLRHTLQDTEAALDRHDEAATKAPVVTLSDFASALTRAEIGCLRVWGKAGKVTIHGYRQALATTDTIASVVVGADDLEGALAMVVAAVRPN